MTDIPLTTPHSRATFRLIATLCVIVMPGLGSMFVTGMRPALADPAFMLETVMLWSVIVHFSLLSIYGARARDRFGQLLVASGLGLLLLPGMPLLPFYLLLGGSAFSQPEILAAVFLWTSGAITVHLSRAAWTILPRRMVLRPLPLGNPSHLVLTGILLGIGFFTALSLLPLIAGDALRIASVPATISATLLALTVSALSSHGFEALRENDDDARPATALLVMAFVAALAVLVLLLSFPELAPMGHIGGVGTVALGGILVAVLLVRQPVMWLGVAALMTGAALLFTASEMQGGLVLQSVFALLLLTILFSIIHLVPGQSDSIAAMGQPPINVMRSFHATAASWVVRIDIADRIVRFPCGAGESLGYTGIARFDEIFSASNYAGLIDLLQLLQHDAKTPPAPVRIELTRGPHSQNRDGSPRILTCEVHLLQARASEAWIALVSLEREKETASRLSRYEQLLGAAIVREERLLSIASHELRTPIAILSMLAEELKSGTDWDDVGTSFEKTLDRIVVILDDLRAGSGDAGGQSAISGFTIRELAQQVLEIFSAAATGNGITLGFTASENSDTLLQSDYSRIFIALSKLIHNAIVHSRGSEVTLSAFIAKGHEDERSVTWQVVDNGVGIEAARRDTIFEPFETGADNTEERVGLGLYTARKAIRLMGGELVLDNGGKGSRFTLTHRARLARQLVKSPEKVLTMNDVVPVYSDRGVLLVEDNKLVGEITSARLRKLFRRVDWAESGDAGLQLFRDNSYDIVVVDQLLPGMIGSELVRVIRETHKTLPVIGITASTMGSECRDLEEAGANYALEKPLSFGQLKSLAEEFFGAGKAPET